MKDNNTPDQCKREAYVQLERALDMVIESLETLSLYRAGECETVEEDGEISLLFQDIALLKDFRQPAEPDSERVHTEGSLSPAECRTPFHTQHSPEWRIQRSYTPKDSIFQFCISLSHGAIEVPTGREFRT